MDFLLRRTANLSFDAFLADETLQRAVVRSFEIIGEASKHVPGDFRERHTTVDWRAMAAMRDRLIHGYFGIDYELVWDVVQHRIPELRVNITAILEP